MGSLLSSTATLISRLQAQKHGGVLLGSVDTLSGSPSC